LAGLAIYLSTVNSTHRCWCGNTEFSDFSEGRLLCENCQTLVPKDWPAAEHFIVDDDGKDFYGQKYYESHLTNDLGLPTLKERARADINERCMHWLRTVLKYKLPPGRSLELGSGHGAFVALLGWAGFDATGLELSPWLVEQARTSFGIPMLTGTLESQTLEAQSLDMILHFDVLEHLADPLGTMRKSMELLKPGGLLIIQTPCLPEDRTYSDLLQEQHRFLEHLKLQEHVFLFSRHSISRLLSDIGAAYVYFEPAIFSHYDMFLVASQRECRPHSAEEISEALLRCPQGRLIQALLDANAQYQELTRRYRESEEDRAARLQLLMQADGQMKEINADREARLQLLNQAQSALAAEKNRTNALEGVLAEIDAAYKRKMSHAPARLLRRVQRLLKTDAFHRVMERNLPPEDKIGKTNPGI
jgi:2-polyprenyl-3-methyl-5-hydroxy-6-metoxy-1,4-benzoquinol methylase